MCKIVPIIISPITKEPFVTVSHGLRGYFAVLMTWEEELGYHTPFNSAFGSYPTATEARQDAETWARAEEIECR
jgi:hypothetical protein